MRNLLGGVAAISMLVPNIACAKATENTSSSAATERCDVSVSEGSSMVEWSFGASNPQLANDKIANAGAKAPSGYAHTVDVSIAPAADGITPAVVWHAIKTKGAGGDRSKPMACDDWDPNSASRRKPVHGFKHFTYADLSARSNPPIVVKDVDNIQFACAVSKDRPNPAVSVSMLWPAGGKVSVQDLHFSISEDGSSIIVGSGPGGGPHVKRADETPVACDAVASADLLLPAIQK